MIAQATAAPAAQKESPASVSALNRANAQRALFRHQQSTFSAPSQARSGLASRTRDRLDRAKQAVGIADLWRRLGLPGEPKSSCRSPFREDKHPSFSISADGRLWRDHATGEGGDGVMFIQRAAGCTNAEAIARLVDIAGTATTPPPRPKAREKKLTLPPLHDPKIVDLADLQHLRGWPLFAGIEVARKRGLFHICHKADNGVQRRAWLLTDSARRAAQVRRMDGSPWDWCSAKAWTLAGSDGGWPVGCADIGERPLVAFCEGSPDMLAALTLAFLHDLHDRLAVCFMAGASADISGDALLHFRGKRVRIFEHGDVAGAKAGPRWAAQLREAGATVDGLRLPAPFKDLSDLLAATDAEHLEPAVSVYSGMEDKS
jgi:hypothetical protein